MLGTNWMKIAPKIAPGIDASPPITTPTRKVIDRNTVKLSGATKATTMPPSAPATPVNAADTPKVSDLNIGRLMPIAVAAIGWSRIAISARPTRPRSRFQASRNISDGDRQREEVEPAVGAERLVEQPERERRLRLVQHDALHAAGPVLDMPLYLSSCGTASASAKVASAR